MIIMREIARQERIRRAREIIVTNPEIGKRGLQSQLLREFGVGLSDTMRRSLLRESNVPSVLRARLNNRDAFTAREAKCLRQIIRRTNVTQYLITVINERTERARELFSQGYKRNEIHRILRQEAKESGYLSDKTTKIKDEKGRWVIPVDGQVKGKIDIWKIVRDERARKIESGEYVVPVKKRKSKSSVQSLSKSRQRYERKQEGRQLRLADEEKINKMAEENEQLKNRILNMTYSKQRTQLNLRYWQTEDEIKRLRERMQ